MNMQEFAEANLNRCESTAGFQHRLDDWSSSDWCVATTGELGEAANVLKKLNRIRDGVAAANGDVTEIELRVMLKKELADVFIYLDLWAQREGFSLQEAVIEKFNETSRKIGYPVILLDMP